MYLLKIRANCGTERGNPIRLALYFPGEAYILIMYRNYNQIRRDLITELRDVNDTQKFTCS